MDQAVPAYSGDKPYVFVCYAHEDSDRVYEEIRRLHDRGVRVWYDEGIPPGMRWSDSLAEALAGASLVLFICTPASVVSPHCNDEISFALDQGLPIVTISLVAVELPPGLKLRLGAHQAILADSLSPAQLDARLEAAITRWVDHEQVQIGQRSPASAVETRPKDRHRRKAWLAGTSLVLAFVAIALVIGWQASLEPISETSGEPRPMRLAVLPFRALGGEDGSRVFASVLTETLIHELSGDSLEPLKGLMPLLRHGWTVAPYTAASRYAGSTEDPRIIAQELGVEYLIGGSVRMESDDRVRVSGELVAVAPNEQWWAQTLSYAQQDSRMETMIARDIAFGAIQSIPEKEWELFTKRSFENQAAWEHYVKAQSLRLSWPGPTYRQEIIQNFERALQLEPEFAYTLEGLLDNYDRIAAERLGPVDTIEPVEVLIARLEKLATYPGDEDRMRRSAAVKRARHAYLQFDFDAASRLAETVLSEDPNNIGAQILLAQFELHRGDTDEALRKFQRSVSAGALVPLVINAVASLQLAAGRSGAAVDYVDEMLAYVRADYNRGRLLLTKAEAQLAQGDTGAALNVIGESERLLAETHPAAIAALLVNTGDTERARNLLSQADQGKVSDAATLIDLVRGYLALGEFEAAARLADEAIRARHVSTIGWLRAYIGTFGVADEPSWMSIRQALDALPAPTRSDARNQR